MYNGKLQARQKGKWITIVKAKPSVKNTQKTDKEKAATEEKQERLVQVKKAWLYNTPEAKGISKLYLIENDKFTILKQKTAQESDWYFIRFIGVKIVEKWIKVSDTKVIKE
jgi:Holliday junction resolvase-like predicted endonuclease